MIAPIIVTNSATAPYAASEGISSTIADTTSIVPVRYRNHWPRPMMPNS